MKLNQISWGLLLSSIILSFSAKASATTLACQNYSSTGFLCLHTNMMILSQGDTSNGKVLVNGVWTAKYSHNRYNYMAIPNRTAASFSPSYYNMGLLEYINLQQSLAAGKPYTEYESWDPGWCGAVSSAMNLRTYSLESGNRNSLGGVYLGNLNVNQFIYQVMKLVKTNIVRGGTFLTDVWAAFNTVTGNHAHLSILPSQQVFAKTIPLQSIPVCNAGGCHYITLHGMEGLNYLINDPWGSIYTVSFNKAASTFNFLSYTYKGTFGGDIPKYGVSTEDGGVLISGYAPVATSPLIAGLSASYVDTAATVSVASTAAIGENNNVLP